MSSPPGPASLTSIFLAHRGHLSDKWEQYLPIYERELAPFVAAGRPVRLLEIGVQNGGSLQLWQQYLPPGSTLVGVDIDPRCADIDAGPNARIVIADAGDEAQIGEALGDETFDVIIDDGSHHSRDIVAAFDPLWARLSPGGVYLIEDLHASYWSTHGGGFRTAGSAIEWLKSLVDALHADHVNEDEVDDDTRRRLQGLNRELGSVEFFDSVAVLWKLPQPKEGPYRRVMTGDGGTVTGAERNILSLWREHPHSVLLTDPVARVVEPALIEAASAGATEMGVPLRQALEEAEAHGAAAVLDAKRVNRQLIAAQEAERAHLEHERDEAVRARDRATGERDAIAADRDGLRLRLTTIEASTTWRALGPVRTAFGVIPHPLRRAARGVAKLGVWTVQGRLLLALRDRRARIAELEAAGRRAADDAAAAAAAALAAEAARAAAEAAAEAEAADAVLAASLRPFDSIGALLAEPVPAWADRCAIVPFGFDPDVGPPPTIAIAAHIFYPEMASEIVRYLRRIPCAADLYITTDTEAKRSQLAAASAAWDRGAVELRVVENRGRDVGAWLVGLADIHDRHELVLHVHSKKSPHSDRVDEWRTFLYETLLGSEEIVRSTIAAFSAQPRLGMIVPQHWEPIRGELNWGYDFACAQELAHRMGFELARDEPLEFPSGSMFWARSTALRPLLDLGLTVDDFPEESGQQDGTTAHAIERLQLRVCEHAGFTWLKIGRPDLLEDHSALVEVPDRAALDRLLRVQELVLEDPARRPAVRAAAFPHVPLFFGADLDTRPRLTLLLPTLNRKSVFGGVATAVALFERFAGAIGADVQRRIVVTTDVRPADEIAVPPGYELVEPSHAVTSEADAIVVNLSPDDPHQRVVDVRAHDIFFASAWSDARHAFDLLAMQRRFFGTGHRLRYFVQDFEPIFHPFSTLWAAAEETYRRPDETIAIVNCEFLAEHLVASGYRFSELHVFQPLWNEGLHRPFVTPPERDNRIVVYYRTTVLRNAAQAAVAALSLWVERDPVGASEWEIVGVGEPGPDIELSNGQMMQNLGRLDLETYEALLRRSKVGISLMLSPHPSYPPLEMAAFGLTVVTNRYGPKDLARYGTAFESVDHISPSLVADALAAAIHRWDDVDGPAASVDIEAAFATDDSLTQLTKEIVAGVREEVSRTGG